MMMTMKRTMYCPSTCRYDRLSHGTWLVIVAVALVLALPVVEARSFGFSTVAFISSSSSQNHNHQHQQQQQPATTTTSFQSTRQTNLNDYDTETATSPASASSSSFQDIAALLPLDLPRRQEALTMLQAVYEACAITQALQPLDHDALETAVQKDDTSPVTVADFAVQARVLHHLQQQQQHTNSTHTIGFIAEEDSAVLRKDPPLGQRVAHAAGLSLGETLAAIDLGKSYQSWTSTSSSSTRPLRVYCLDPIDGTRGFLRGKRTGGQYAIALALLEEGVPVIGVLGCPNLPHNDDDDVSLEWKKDASDDEELQRRGCLFVAVQGGGCYQLPLVVPTKHSAETTAARRLHVSPPPINSGRSLAEGRFCIGVEKYSDARGQTAGMSQHIRRRQQDSDAITTANNNKIDNDNNDIPNARRMDSQAKHGVIARGGAEWYVRLPKPGYVEWIWDHAAGYVVATEAGGVVTDTHGRAIDFSLGAQLSSEVQGVLMSAGGDWHEALVDAYAAVDEDAHNNPQEEEED